MADSSHDGPPGLPTVHDEAGDTPMWLPIVGLVLLVLSLLSIVWRGAREDYDTERPPVAAPSVEAAAAE